MSIFVPQGLKRVLLYDDETGEVVDQGQGQFHLLHHLHGVLLLKGTTSFITHCVFCSHHKTKG